MKIEQFVVAYGVEQDRLRAILPQGFASLRPVLRINAEIADDKTAYLELNTAVEYSGQKGWLNIGHWQDVSFTREGDTVVFRTQHLEIAFTATGLQGGCPAEKDNAGCWFLPQNICRSPEQITVFKEFCDCSFRWDFDGAGASGKSIGKTLPAIPTEPKTVYPKADFTVYQAAIIPCEQVLGSYKVVLDRA